MPLRMNVFIYLFFKARVLVNVLIFKDMEVFDNLLYCYFKGSFSC